MLTLIVLFTTFNTASSHPSGVTCSGGSELLGWMVKCDNHQSKNSFTYSISGLDLTYSQIALNGAAKWSGTVNITYTASAHAAQGVVSSYYDSESTTVAYAGEYVSDSNGHFKSWKIMYNKYYMDERTNAKNSETAAHEFGHVIGLKDLTSSSNISQLMYGSSNRTASNPTTKDINGAKEATRN